MSRTATISYDLTKAWEVWKIDIDDPDAPDEITAEWLLANQDKWEYFDLKDRGGEMDESTMEVEDYT